MEEYFGFDIPNEEAEKIQTVEAAINTFFRHLNSQVANKVVEKNEGDSTLQGNKNWFLRFLDLFRYSKAFYL